MKKRLMRILVYTAIMIGSMSVTVSAKSEKIQTHELMKQTDKTENAVQEMQSGEVLEDVPVRFGYLFEGWYTDKAYKHRFSGTMPDKDLVIYAKWKAQEQNYHVLHYQQDIKKNRYTLTDEELFRDITGAEVKPDTRTYEGFRTPEKKSGYVDGNGELYIHYYYKRRTYRITYVKNNYEADRTEKLPYGADISYRPKREGYAFAGWYLDKKLTKPWTEQKVPAKDLTIYAKWEKGKTSYQVRHYLQKDSADEAYELAETQNFTGMEGDAVTPQTGHYEGFQSPEVVTCTLEPDNNVVKYYYRRNRYQITYQTGNDMEEGMQSRTEELPYGRKIERLEKRPGYCFHGWYLDPECTRAFDGNVPAEDLTLYGKWKVQEANYCVKHYIQDENKETFTLKKVEVLHADTDSIVTPKVRSYEGYTAPETQTVKVKGDGSLVVEYRYLRDEQKKVVRTESSSDTARGSSESIRKGENSKKESRSVGTEKNYRHKKEREYIKKKIRVAVTGDVAKCGLTTCIMLTAAGIVVEELKKREDQ